MRRNAKPVPHYRRETRARVGFLLALAARPFGHRGRELHRIGFGRSCGETGAAAGLASAYGPSADRRLPARALTCLLSTLYRDAIRHYSTSLPRWDDRRLTGAKAP
jgi:hypothetical protein